MLNARSRDSGVECFFLPQPSSGLRTPSPGFSPHRSGSGKGRSALLPCRNSVRVTVFTFHKMNIVPAGGRLERRIHVFDVEAAVGQTRMAQGAGGPGVLVVSRVTGQATQPFMHSHTGAIVA